MELSFIYAVIGFSLAGLSVFGNDSIQTLGTFIAAKKKWYKWYVLATAASLVLVGTLTYGWVAYDGDITFGRLNKIPYIEIQWYHAVAPLVLVMLTRVGIPVSTTFLVLSAFASTVILEKVLLKSIVGYAIAASAAYVVWFVVSKYINEKDDEITDPKKTGFLEKFTVDCLRLSLGYVVNARCCKYSSVFAKKNRSYALYSCNALFRWSSLLHFLERRWANSKNCFRKNRH
jgi:phosphate/sulfate permease